MNRTLIAALVMASIFGTISCAKSGSGDAATNNTNTTATTSSSKDITTFSILGQAGTIGTNTIGVTVPFGTNLTALVATFTINGTSMEISGVTQVSGTTANNFTTAKNYTVIAADGSTKTYTVTVNTNAKDITAFSILGQTGTIGASTVNVTVPYGTNVTALVPTFTITGASVNIASVNQTSGTTANDFTAAKTYTVVAGDASTKNYTVTVTVASCTLVLMGGKSNCVLSLGLNVTTLAGPPQGTFSIGDIDATGTAARFNGPFGITTDGTNLFAMDGNKIRKIVIATGAVTTLAGPAQGANTSGDTDATGNAARFSGPNGITTDGTNLYVADSTNNKIRQVVIATGVVTTIAGPASGTTTSGDTDATGSAARFSNPKSITTDGTNLYVADTGNNKIRKITIAAGIVTTLAGPATNGNLNGGDVDATGNAARFASPRSLASDGTNLYVYDNNRKIRKIVISSGAVSTFAGQTATLGDTDGTGTGALFNDVTGMTTDGTFLYATDRSTNKIRKIVLATAVVTTPVGPAAGTSTQGDTEGNGNAVRFWNLEGITTDGVSLFVADWGNNKVRKIN